ncbi:divergent polysaccharide deacetylase family protein [Pseudaminobacter sp. 19-2017]|uniref:Divergent polysaccharide deacetylase family protein n=1 Tax=Pseudaminobacter soli (ex Zhang et al. 2022) TaxID=2831468 RepID=A0A942E3C9_9HYPH|nr:divergent polysaccharide deacetylase family protein [Pseudaminobacter soli]MBS3649845.1 divergent polysaccharide deacetylase family protein [Pseudaminobacter soli]
MSLNDREIDRPLGQGTKGRGSRKLNLTLNSVLSTVVALVILGSSTAIALRERPFRHPAPVAVATVEPAENGTESDATSARTVEAGSSDAPAEAPSQPSGGPRILKVQPGDNPGQGAIVIRDPSALGQNLRVAHLPDRDLIEESDTGPLPVRAADGRRPFDVYARPWSGARGARVAIVLGGLAISQTGTQAAIEKLPAEITLAFSPQGNSIDRWMQAARRKGHEIVMQVPLEPYDYPNVDPGKNTLTTEASAQENVGKLNWALSRTTNYTGIMNFMGARFSADAEAMQPLFADLGKRGLLYLDDGSSARSVAPELALKNGVPFAAADATLDANRERGEIMKKLDELERTARAKGFAIGIGSAFGETVDAVSAWVSEARKRGMEIVPISALAIDPER